jgi:hypothetical protein
MKTIQTSIGEKWVDICEIDFCNAPSYYRIKPEHREWTAWAHDSGMLLCNEVTMNGVPGWRKIRVREILD